MRRLGLLAEDFEGPRFVRLARIRELMATGRLADSLHLAASGRRQRDERPACRLAGAD